jgi:hypothetical protein
VNALRERWGVRTGSLATSLLHAPNFFPSLPPSLFHGNAGAAVIGSAMGLGNEHDRKLPPTTAAHELVLLSLRTLANLSVPSGRLILLVKVSRFMAGGVFSGFRRNDAKDACVPHCDLCVFFAGIATTPGATVS